MSALGAVLLRRTGAQAWTVHKPDGCVLATPGTRTHGFQEAINYSCAKQYPLIVNGGGSAYPGAPAGQEASANLICDDGVIVPPTTSHWIELRGVNLIFTEQVTGNALTFNSADMFHFKHSGQIIYYQPERHETIIAFNPTTPNQENFTGITSSYFETGDVVCVDANGTPTRTTGLGAVWAASGGIIINSMFKFGMVNGGDVGWQINDPAPFTFERNHLIAHGGIHDSGSWCVNVGTGATDGIRDNTFTASLFTEEGTHLNVYGQGNLFTGAIPAGSGTGILLQPGADENMFMIPSNRAATPVVDHSISKNNPGAHGWKI